MMSYTLNIIHVEDRLYIKIFTVLPTNEVHKVNINQTKYVKAKVVRIKVIIIENVSKMCHKMCPKMCPHFHYKVMLLSECDQNSIE